MTRDDDDSYIGHEIGLAVVLENLSQTIGALEVQQKRQDALGQRIVSLIKARETNWDGTARAALTSLSGRHNLQKRALDKARSDYAEACDRATERLRQYEDIRRRFRQLEYSRLASSDMLARRQGALSRAIQSMIELRRFETGAPDRDAAGYVVQEGAYDYIPYDLNRFLDMLIRVDLMLSQDPDHADPKTRYRPVRFLEAGAGPGRNLMLAKASQLLACREFAGFDLNAEEVASGHRAFGLDKELFVADALTFDYAPYDVIYAYRLFRDNDLQHRLETRMVETMRPGAYLIAPFPFDLTLQPGLFPADPAYEIWKKRAMVPEE